MHVPLARSEVVSVARSDALSSRLRLPIVDRAIPRFSASISATWVDLNGRRGVYRLSDGCRVIDRVRGADGSRYEYPRYRFTNVSDDIRALFTRACDVVGADWKVMNRYDIAVSRRESVALLDTFIGPRRDAGRRCGSEHRRPHAPVASVGRAPWSQTPSSSWVSSPTRGAPARRSDRIGGWIQSSAGRPGGRSSRTTAPSTSPPRHARSTPSSASTSGWSATSPRDRQRWVQCRARWCRRRSSTSIRASSSAAWTGCGNRRVLPTCSRRDSSPPTG